MNTIKFSVIGFGRIGKRHAKIIQEYEHSSLISVTDNDAGQFEGAEELNIEAKTYSSINAFLEQDRGESDVVNICTPNGFHTEYAVRLLNAGYHVVIEKPMGLTKEGCLDVIGAQEASGKRVFVVKQNRYSPPSVWMKSVVDEKRIGDVLMVQEMHL